MQETKGMLNQDLASIENYNNPRTQAKAEGVNRSVSSGETGTSKNVRYTIYMYHINPIKYHWVLPFMKRGTVCIIQEQILFLCRPCVKELSIQRNKQEFLQINP